MKEYDRMPDAAFDTSHPRGRARRQNAFRVPRRCLPSQLIVTAFQPRFPTVGKMGVTLSISLTFRQAYGRTVGRSRAGRIYCSDHRSIAYQKKIERSRMKAPIQISAIGIKGLTFETSCDSSVATAPAK